MMLFAAIFEDDEPCLYHGQEGNAYFYSLIWGPSMQIQKTFITDQREFYTEMKLLCGDFEDLGSDLVGIPSRVAKHQLLSKKYCIGDKRLP